MKRFLVESAYEAVVDVIFTHNVIGNKTYKLKNYSNTVAIHDLYANMQFYFSYPLSETQSYYLLQDCLVALYYQMYFVRRQCDRGNTFGNGWGYCKYGDGVECDDEGVGGVDGNGKGCTSWICKEAVKNGEAYAKQEQNKRTFKDLEQNDCGQKTGNNPSPLQAFLTDCLKGFTCPVLVGDQGGYKDNLEKLRSSSDKNNKKSYALYSECYPEFLSHRGHPTVPGTECAVPMGFSGCFREGSGTQPASGSKDGMIGLGINAVLAYYASDAVSTAGLYQITRCICSLTRRVPRSTGTLYGFFYGLGLVYGNKRKQEFKKALEGELRSCPGWREPSCLLDAIKEWTESDHSKKHTEKNSTGNYTLGSLHGCNNGESGLTCGQYMRPLTGYLYNCLAPEFCETYVSWIVHLSWILHSGLRSLLDEFTKIDCEKSGCTGKGGGKTPCECPGSGCTKGSHGDRCCCDSVVFCAGVHGLFYRFGFTYNGPGWLVYDGYKRDCKQFSEQLGKVITEKPFQDLSKQLRKFIYSTRALFGLYIGVYWLAVMGYLLWSMTVNLDLMHIQSHWRSPRSYLVPLQRILADGSRKGFCTLGYFQEGTGDSLLSLCVSDVYL
ncbi:variant erythrocyte surface antigen beta subunit, putative [Babesia ovis]|uniref:Variant erythrocyte surface antigen beta subunit, putative n=1 Tax=Babesia ovis TaxID=5869 RepID=A0A9W5TEU8_BABOV|nr:variant erythrocyte surface antigen beta subunit, putative [Babesia ovis]